MLEIDGLSIDFMDVEPPLRVVEDFSLRMEPGEIVGVVGESGSGKTMTALAVMGLLKRRARITSGRMLFQGKDLLALSQKEWEAVRGHKISMIFQEPMTSLNPVLTIGGQMEESLRLHTDMDRKERRRRVLEMMGQVGLAQPEKLYGCYPHQLSGGMRQRVMIGAALIGRPKLMVADEPTTALDVTIQAQILELMQKMRKQYAMSLILITHDLGVIASMCTRVIVMYGGIIVEEGDVRDIFYRTAHPYTKGLLESIPKANGEKLVPIFGTPPDLLNPPAGCPFAARCPYAMKLCHAYQPELGEVEEGHKSACWLHHPQVKKNIEVPDLAKRKRAGELKAQGKEKEGGVKLS